MFVLFCFFFWLKRTPPRPTDTAEPFSDTAEAPASSATDPLADADADADTDAQTSRAAAVAVQASR